MLSMFDFLNKISDEALLSAITDEHPQTIALICCCVQPYKAAGVINGLPPERQLAVLRRMATISPVETQVVEMVAVALKEQISDADTEKFDGITLVAKCLLGIELGTRRNILENLSQDDPEMVDDLNKEMERATRKMIRGAKD